MSVGMVTTSRQQKTGKPSPGEKPFAVNRDSWIDLVKFSLIVRHIHQMLIKLYVVVELSGVSRILRIRQTANAESSSETRFQRSGIHRGERISSPHTDENAHVANRTTGSSYHQPHRGR